MTRYVIRAPGSSVRPSAGRPFDLDGDLNPAQREVVAAGSGPMLVIAGAGTGKTRTLTYRAAYLIARGLDPQNLLLCTFTTRAAREMVRRVEGLLDAEIRLPWAGTFHHIANLALRRHSQHLDLDPDYSILDREDARELIASCLAEEGNKLRARRFPRPQLLQHICSTAINRQIEVADAVRREAPRFVEITNEIAAVISRYHNHKRRLSLLDYDDLLLLLRNLLVQHPHAAEPLLNRFHQVLVDEYQDTNKIQGEIVDICASRHGNLTAVGDDAQSIYSFRGAHIDNIIDFPRRYPKATVCRLETNYRSTPEVLRLANKSIRHNTRQHPKKLQAARSAGMQPVLLPLQDVYQQAAFVAQRLLELHQEEDVALAQMAVLYRAHSHSLELQLELARRNIPYAVRSGLRFFEQAHIKDVVAYLRVVHNPTDLLAWQRVLRTWSGVGRRSASYVLDQLLDRPRQAVPSEVLTSDSLARKLPTTARPAVKRLASLLDQLQDGRPLWQMIRQVLDGHYADYLQSAFANATVRQDDLRQLSDYAKQYDTIESFLSEVALVAGFAAEGAAPGQTPDDALTLSSIHQAKGLEWRVVFVIGLAEGRFPQAMAIRTPAELEEERRLFYVAATRAKDQLYLCYPRFEEPDNGPRKLLRLSRFVDELSYDGQYPYERWEIEEG